MLLSYAGSRREVKHNLGYIVPCLFCRIQDVTLLTLPPLYLGYIYWPESTVFDKGVRTYQRAGGGTSGYRPVKSATSPACQDDSGQPGLPRARWSRSR